MRMECTQCGRAVELRSLQLIDGLPGFECPHCDAPNRLPVTENAQIEAATAQATTQRAQDDLASTSADPARAAADPPAAQSEPAPTSADLLPTSADPEDTTQGAAEDAAEDPTARSCPKCGWRQPQLNRECHRCGLDLVRWAQGQIQLPAQELAHHPMLPVAQQAWAKAEAALDDAATHHAFIRLCAQHDLLEFAGQRYRELAERATHPQAAAQIAAYRQRVLQAAFAQLKPLAQAQEFSPQRMRTWILWLAFAALFAAFAVGLYLFSQYQTAAFVRH